MNPEAGTEKHDAKQAAEFLAVEPTARARANSLSPCGEVQGTVEQPITASRQLMNITELAGWLGVPKSWIYDRTRCNGPDRIPHLKMGKYLRFDPESEAFKEWLRTHEVRRSLGAETNDQLNNLWRLDLTAADSVGAGQMDTVGTLA